MAKKAVNLEEPALEALARALADPVPLKMHGTKASPGIFLSSAQKFKDAANLCLQRGWLEGTGEFVGKGKTRKETYKITGSGVQYVLENGEIPSLLRELLQVNDSHLESVRHAQQTLADTNRAMTSQHDLLEKLREKVTSPPSPPSGNGAPTSVASPWEQEAVEYVRRFRRQHQHRSCPFSELYKAVAEPRGVTIGQFHDGLRHLSRQKKISLRPWTGAMSDLDEDYLALVQAKETKFYADPVD